MNSRLAVQKEIGHRLAGSGHGAGMKIRRRGQVSGRQKSKKHGKEEKEGKLKSENKKEGRKKETNT
jgi:hypothetical protein